MADKLRVLIVDDQAHWSQMYREEIELYELASEIRVAASTDEALAMLESWPCDLLITDFQMPKRSGVELAREVRAKWPEIKIVMVTGGIKHAIAAMGSQPSDYVHKLMGKSEFNAPLIFREYRNGFNSA